MTEPALPPKRTFHLSTPYRRWLIRLIVLNAVIYALIALSYWLL